jgi:hypothetical protein
MGSTTSTAVTTLGTVQDSKGNTIGGATVTITGSSGTVYTGASNADGTFSGQFTIPSGVTSLSLTLSISGKNALPVTIPVSVQAACKEDNNRGHGNDADGVDEDNTGNSTGVNSNAMENRNSNDKKKDKCASETKYLSKIGNITLPLQASQLAFLKENSNLLAYINGFEQNNIIFLFVIIAFASLAIFLRRRFLTN